MAVSGPYLGTADYHRLSISLTSPAVDVLLLEVRIGDLGPGELAWSCRR